MLDDQKNEKAYHQKNVKERVKIDIIILSYAKNAELKKLTEQTIDTLFASEDPDLIVFNVVVMESNRSLKPFQFERSLTLYPDTPFGFNKYLNIGIKATESRYICLCNNDLIFHQNWAREILNVMGQYPAIQSANPFCDDFSYSVPVTPDKSLIIGKPANFFKGVLTGWCIFIKRDMFKVTGLLDEQFSFWYADRDYGRTLLKHHIGHALVRKSVVTHLGNRSHGALSDSRLEELTHAQLDIYIKKWGKDQVSVLYRIKGFLLRIRNKLSALLR